MQAQIDFETREIIAWGDFPSGVTDTSSSFVVTLLDSELSKMAELGTKTLNEDGTITVTPPDPNFNPFPVADTSDTNKQLAEVAAQHAAILDDPKSTREDKDAAISAALKMMSAILLGETS